MNLQEIKKHTLINKLIFEIQKIFANLICEKENTDYTKAYKRGLITPNELIQNSQLKDIYTNCKPIK